MYGGHGKVLRAPKCLRIVHEKASKGIKFTSYSDQCVRWPWPLKRRGTAWYSFWMWFEPSLRVCVLVHCSLLFILCSCGHPVCLNQDSLQVALPILHSRYSHQIVLHVQPSDRCSDFCSPFSVHFSHLLNSDWWITHSWPGKWCNIGQVTFRTPDILILMLQWV